MIFFSFIFLTLFVHEGLSTSWSYTGANGVDNWASLFPAFCAGTKQSPVNIDTLQVKRKFEKPFVFENYDAVPTSMKMTNNGHSAKLTLISGLVPLIKNGGLRGSYVFDQLHFHWGSDNMQGSEHTIDGVKYPMEMHLVHHNTRHADLTTALGDPKGVAVLGFMFEICSTDNPVFDSLVAALANVPISGDFDSTVAPFALETLLPSDLKGFYRYRGSLTTPNCNEAVIWTVFKKPIPISENQLAGFRVLFDSDFNSMVDNYRPTQPLNGRTVLNVGTERTCTIIT